MSRAVVIRPEAETDLAAARDWYEDRMAGLGVEFGREIDSLLSALAERALGFPVFFMASEDLVVVLAVLHQARDPAVWKRRA